MGGEPELVKKFTDLIERFIFFFSCQLLNCPKRVSAMKFEDKDSRVKLALRIKINSFSSDDFDVLVRLRGC